MVKHCSLIFCMQDGNTPAIEASLNGHTETLALLLANKADVNSTNKVKQFKLFSCL
jgi:ankyrin repeat protein